MSEIKALDRLREKVRLDVNNPWSDLKGDLLVMCDKVEREIAERYMELPLDADGVPIRPREEVSTGMGDNGPIGHLEYWYPNHWVAVIEYKPGQFTRYDPAAIRHFKPRTLEDVLQDLIDAAAEIHAHALDDDIPDAMDNLIGEYADKVREAVGDEAASQ